MLLPSLDLEVCVCEIVRRQVARPIGRSPEREESVIRERHPIYMAIPATRIETMRPVTEIVEQMIVHLLSCKTIKGDIDHTKVSKGYTHQDRWVKTEKGWMLKKVEELAQGEEIVDGQNTKP